MIAVPRALIIDGITTWVSDASAITDDFAEENVARKTGNWLTARPDAGIRRIGGQLSTKLSTVLVEIIETLRNGGKTRVPAALELVHGLCAKDKNCGEGKAELGSFNVMMLSR